MVRVYLAATVTRMEQWLAAGQARLEPEEVAHAVTPALREWYYEADLDELEHVAQLAAAAAALAQIAADPAAPPRRIVVAAEVDDAAAVPRPGNGRSAISLDQPVPVGRWASALVDGRDAADVVAAAVSSLPAAAAGDDDAQFALDEAAAHELGWYAVQELPHLSA